ncbi:hypothetical protein GQ55_4G273300 [Panicum hallii var. hallii]|uniref:FLZ-type domain-containing protein n=1 Tax=Panicum hallii var. hallii TaxID=1504633 RepID=A0A2T7E0P8_9POAL|nr:hypothetical protein GQ55_4G273300 [Panicum hallii var. hallii]
MPTRKRPRNSSSASRSSGGGVSTTSPAAMRRTTSLSDLAQPQEMEAGRAPARPARGEAAALGAGMRRHSASADCFTVPEAAFLKACGLCKRGLGPGRDTFIYMGEVAFCSQECRQHQMNLDELREKKCSTPAGGGSGGGSDPSGKSSTIAAA